MSFLRQMWQDFSVFEFRIRDLGLRPIHTIGIGIAPVHAPSLNRPLLVLGLPPSSRFQLEWTEQYPPTTLLVLVQLHPYTQGSEAVLATIPQTIFHPFKFPMMSPLSGAATSPHLRHIATSGLFSSFSFSE